MKRQFIVLYLKKKNHLRFFFFFFSLLLLEMFDVNEEKKNIYLHLDMNTKLERLMRKKKS